MNRNHMERLKRCTGFIGCGMYLSLQVLWIQAESTESRMRSIEISAESSKRNLEDSSNLDQLKTMLSSGFKEQENALRIIFRNPQRFRDSEIEEEVLRLCYEAEDVDIRYYAIRSYARLKGPEDSDIRAIVNETLESEEPKLRLIGAYAIFETDDPRKGVEMMVSLVLSLESGEIREEIWTAVSVYLRHEEAFRYEIKWPEITDTDQLLKLLSIELGDSERFWEDNEIRKNLREISRAARYYFTEHLEGVTVNELYEKEYLRELPESIQGEKYEDIFIRSGAHASRLSVTTGDGREIR